MDFDAQIIESVDARLAADWPWWKRVGFRFAFIYWGITCLQGGILWHLTWFAPWLLAGVLRWPLMWLGWPASAITSWLSSHVFHLGPAQMSGKMTGSGDTALAWVQALSLLVFSAIAAAVWSGISETRKRRYEYRKLYVWLHLAMRFTLASVLLGYGFSKVFDLQFSPPSSWRLSETYGASSPMGLLWTFIGFSVPYTVFAGLAEVVPGVLLLFRRTSTAGALGAATVLLNVVVLNFCYDVPVKLYSVSLLAMALFLLLPDAAPMWRFFVLRRETTLAGPQLPRWERKPLRVAGYCLQAIVIGHMLYGSVAYGLGQWRNKAQASAAPVAPAPANEEVFDGRWMVDGSRGWPEGEQWTSVTIGSTRYRGVDYIVVEQANGKTTSFSETMDFSHAIHFLGKQDSELQWIQSAPDKVTLEGTWAGRPAQLTMHTQTAASKEFPLMTRGFHWVQETPFNR